MLSHGCARACVVSLFFHLDVRLVWQWVHMVYVVCLFKTAEASTADRKPFMSRLVGLLVQCAGGGICVAIVLGQPAPWLISSVYVPGLLAAYFVVFYIPFALLFSLWFPNACQPAPCELVIECNNNKQPHMCISSPHPVHLGIHPFFTRVMRCHAHIMSTRTLPHPAGSCINS